MFEKEGIKQVSAVKDLSKLPIGTKIEKVIDGKVISTLHTISAYENYKYLLEDETGNLIRLTIRELMWGNFKIHFQENIAKESTRVISPHRRYY